LRRLREIQNQDFVDSWETVQITIYQISTHLHQDNRQAEKRDAIKASHQCLRELIALKVDIITFEWHKAETTYIGEHDERDFINDDFSLTLSNISIVSDGIVALVDYMESYHQQSEYSDLFIQRWIASPMSH
jgi:hypothetical protein